MERKGEWLIPTEKQRSLHGLVSPMSIESGLEMVDELLIEANALSIQADSPLYGVNAATAHEQHRLSALSLSKRELAHAILVRCEPEVVAAYAELVRDTA